MIPVYAVITAYNEAQNLGPLMERMAEVGRQWNPITTIVVDDGSSDDTVAVAREHGCLVAVHPVNLGQGYALLTGFKLALMYCPDDGYIVELDGDGQHDPIFIPRLVHHLAEQKVDIVVGSRILGSNYHNAPFFRRTMLPYYTKAINRITGYDLTDTMCGFRGFKAGSLRRMSAVLDRMLEPQYIAAEMFMRFSHAGLTISEAPIDLQDRTSGKSRKGFIRYGVGVLRAMCKAWLDQNYRRKK